MLIAVFVMRHCVVCVVWCVVACIFQADDAGAISAIEKSQASVGKTVRNYRLIDQDASFFAFYSLKGKPVLLTFIYTECPGPCPLICESIKAIHESMGPELTEQIWTVAVSFDPLNDTPGRLKEFGLEFVDNFDNWIFATTDYDTLEMMVDDLGFRFDRNENGFEHMNRLTLIGRDGVVLKHFYGTEYDVKNVEDAVRSALEGRTIKSAIADSFDWALLYCSNYDPATKTYKIDYLFVFAVIAQYILIVGTLLFIFRKKIWVFFSHLFKRGFNNVN